MLTSSMFASQPAAIQDAEKPIPIELKRHVISLRKSVWHRKGFQDEASASNARYDTTVIQQ